MTTEREPSPLPPEPTVQHGQVLLQELADAIEQGDSVAFDEVVDETDALVTRSSPADAEALIRLLGAQASPHARHLAAHEIEVLTIATGQFVGSVMELLLADTNAGVANAACEAMRAILRTENDHVPLVQVQHLAEVYRSHAA